MKFLAIRSSLAVSSVSCRINLTAYTSQLFLSGFGEITISRNKRRAYQLLVLFLEGDTAVLRSIQLVKFRKTSQRPKRTLPRSNACHPPRNRQPRRQPKHLPGSNTILCFNFVFNHFLDERVKQAGRSLSGVLSYYYSCPWSFHRDFKEEAVVER